MVERKDDLDLISRVKSITIALVLAVCTNIFSQQEHEADSAGDLLWKRLDARIAEIAERFEGVIGVAIVDLTDGRIISRNIDRMFPTASSIKIAILLELYHQDQQARGGMQGKAKLDDIYTFDPKELVEFSQIMAGLTPGVTRVTNRDLARFMVAVSDNTAANILIERVGKDNVNTMLRGLGLTKTMLRRKMMDFAAARRGEENVSTPQEMARLLEAIYKEKLLNKELNAAFVKQLSTLKESYIPHDLPAGVQVANKPGNLQNVRTDSGIVFVKNRPFAISVMTADARDERAAERAISEMALEAYRYFETRSKSSH
jgi:beta-lactamase class A